MAHTRPGEKMSDLGQVLQQGPYKPELLTGSFVVSLWNASSYMGESTSAASSRLELFLETTYTKMSVVPKYEIIHGLFGPFIH